MTSTAASLGAPVTEPGGNVAASSSAHPTPGRRRPARCSPGGPARDGSSTAHSSGTSTDPYSHTRPRSLRMRSTIITFSARSLARNGPPGAAVPLIGRVSTTVARPAEEQLGRRRGHLHAGRRHPDGRGVRSRVAPGQRADARPSDVEAGRQRCGQPAAEVDLVDVAVCDGLADGADALGEALGVEAGRPHAGRDRRRRRRRQLRRRRGRCRSGRRPEARRTGARPPTFRDRERPGR